MDFFVEILVMILHSEMQGHVASSSRTSGQVGARVTWNGPSLATTSLLLQNSPPLYPHLSSSAMEQTRAIRRGFCWLIVFDVGGISMFLPHLFFFWNIFKVFKVVHLWIEKGRSDGSIWHCGVVHFFKQKHRDVHIYMYICIFIFLKNIVF